MTTVFNTVRFRRSVSSSESRRQEMTEQKWYAAEDCSRSVQQRLEKLGRCKLRVGGTGEQTVRTDEAERRRLRHLDSAGWWSSGHVFHRVATALGQLLHDTRIRRCESCFMRLKNVVFASAFGLDACFWDVLLKSMVSYRHHTVQTHKQSTFGYDVADTYSRHSLCQSDSSNNNNIYLQQTSIISMSIILMYLWQVHKYDRHRY